MARHLFVRDLVPANRFIRESCRGRPGDIAVSGRTYGATGDEGLQETNECGRSSELIRPELMPRSMYGRARLAYRLTRFAISSARQGYWDFVGNATRSFVILMSLAAVDGARHKRIVTCNLCGWAGRRFYPNTGPGYNERDSICPGCLASDRYRTLFEILRECTSIFEESNRIVEVAPLRSLEKVFLTHSGLNYTSFDIERHAMERGDITKMRFDDHSVNWFICFHVLEHIPDEVAALTEIHRVLTAGGSAVFQVPIDWGAATTREYPAPDPRDVNHVRRYGRDFAKRISVHGFALEQIDVAAALGASRISEAGLSTEPIFVARAIK